MKKTVKMMVKFVIWMLIIAIAYNYLIGMWTLFRWIIATKSLVFDKTYGIGLVTTKYGTLYKTLFRFATDIFGAPIIIYGLIFLKDVINGKVLRKGNRVAA